VEEVAEIGYQILLFVAVWAKMSPSKALFYNVK